MCEENGRSLLCGTEAEGIVGVVDVVECSFWDGHTDYRTKMTEEEENACEFELTSAVHAFIQESIQWTNQNRRVRLFDYLPERLVTWLDSHPSSGKVTNPSITTSIS